MPTLDFDEIARLCDSTQALYHLHLATVSAEGVPVDLPALLAEGAPLRARLLSTAGLMVTFGHVPAERVAAVRRGSGHLELVEALGTSSNAGWRGRRAGRRAPAS
jgi:hypothetical protein